MPHIGPMELIIVLGIVVVIFGAGKLADLGGALGKGIRQFREETTVEPNPSEATAAASTAPAAKAAAAPAPAAAAPVSTAASDACPSCGRANPNSQPFCGGCGASLKTPAATA